MAHMKKLYFSFAWERYDTNISEVDVKVLAPLSMSTWAVMVIY